MKNIMAIQRLILAALVFSITQTTHGEVKLSSTTTSSIESSNQGIPRIRFETNFYNFGRVTGVETLSGIFKFKNVGNAILKVDPPLPGCECTESKVKPETLAPGETGEVIYTIKLDHAEHNEQKYIRVHSNDPKTPSVELTMQFDYTPLYERSPLTLWMTLPAGKDEAQGHFNITRTDGKPLGISRLTTSQPWINAAFDSSTKPDQNSAQINVTVHRPQNPPSMINATVQLWTTDQTDHPVQTIPVTGDIQGELVANPSQLYWIIPDFGKDKASYPPQSLTKTIELKSVLGKPVEIKRASSNIKGLSVSVVPDESKKSFVLTLKFNELPHEFLNGNVVVETSLASLPRLEVPLTIAVPGTE